MKPFRFLLSLFIVFASTLVASAQLCGQYKTALNLESDADPENVFVQILPVTTDETKGKVFEQSDNDARVFEITFLEGHILKNSYKLYVSASGYDTAELELNFPHCENQEFDIKLKRGTDPAEFNFAK